MTSPLVHLPATLNRLVDEGTLRGAVAGIAIGREQYVTTAGTTSTRADRKPTAPTDRFLLTSVAKPLTAAQVLLLVDTGRIGLDDPVERFVPMRTGGVLIRHLLDHTSGISSSANLIEGEEPIDLTMDELVEAAASAPLDWTPGAKARYCSPGFWLLAAVISESSGVSYVRHFQGAIASRLGMRTTAYGSGTNPSDYAAPRTDKKHHLADQVLRLQYPAGGIVSTATDVLRFGSAMVESSQHAAARGWLSPTMLDRLWTIPDRNQSGDAGSEAFHLGWRVHGSGRNAMLWHQGASGTMLWLDRRSCTAVTMLSADWYLEDDVFREVAEAGFADSRELMEEKSHACED